MVDEISTTPITDIMINGVLFSTNALSPNGIIIDNNTLALLTVLERIARKVK